MQRAASLGSRRDSSIDLSTEVRKEKGGKRELQVHEM